jgi:hypothetical protein
MGGKINILTAIIRIWAAVRKIYGEKIEVNAENVAMFLECAEYTKKAGGLRKLHEFLREADEAQLLEEIDSLIK